MKYQRVAQRLKEKFGFEPFQFAELEKMIYMECGTDQRTVSNAVEIMIKKLSLIVEMPQETNPLFGVKKEKKYKLSDTNIFIY